MLDSDLICHRCGALLKPGDGNFYLVRIESVADPTPPSLSGDESAGDVQERIKDLIEQMRGMSERELMDQIHRRLDLYLCGNCHHGWIENPTG